MEDLARLTIAAYLINQGCTTCGRTATRGLDEN